LDSICDNTGEHEPEVDNAGARDRAVRLTRVYVDAQLVPGALFALPAETAAHVAKVLRARSGDALLLFNGDGREFSGEIDSVRGSNVSVAIGAANGVDRESPLQLTLLQCIPRGDRMDFILQKATELGVTRIVPIVSQRSVVRLDERQAQAKAAHWRAVAISACEQCGRNRLPTLDAPQRLLDYLGGTAAVATRLVLDPAADGGGMGHEAGGGMEIAVGPEGGFAPDELDALRTVGFVPIRLGPRILRTETAAIAAVTVLQTRFGDL
jgi:16S rRNA (uracil1498-N3)-methyltransferase